MGASSHLMPPVQDNNNRFSDLMRSVREGINVLDDIIERFGRPREEEEDAEEGDSCSSSPKRRRLG